MNTPSPTPKPSPDQPGFASGREATSIVVTGSGLVTCLGLDRVTTWEAVKQGRCGIGPMSVIEQTLTSDKGGGQAPDLPPDYFPDRPREQRYLRWAMSEALRDAGYGATLPVSPDRVALVLCTTLHGMRSGGRFLRTGDPRHLKTFLGGSCSGDLASAIGGVGMGVTTCSSCASGLDGVGLGITLLDTNQADIVVVAGYDTVSEYVYAGFNSLRLVADGSIKPFAKTREGMKVAEGYGVVILERKPDAIRRNASIFTTILGQGESSDSHHLTQPHPRGDGASRAITEAITKAGISPHEIGFISAHATATPDNDAAEHAALAKVFGDALKRVPVVGFKAHIGHTLGAAGVVELILSATGLQQQTIPPTPNVVADEVEFPDLRLSTELTIPPTPIRATLGCSLGFGGTNACVVLGPGTRVDKEGPSVTSSAGSVHLTRDMTSQSHPADPGIDSVVITGIGAVLPGIVGAEALKGWPRDPVGPRLTRDPGAVDEAMLDDLIRVKRARRMSPYVKLSLAAAILGLRDAGIETGSGSDSGFGSGFGAVLGTTHGAPSFCHRYYRQVVDDGIDFANPVLFAEGVPNAGSAHLSIALGLRGSCQAIIGTRASGLDALRLAERRIAGGEWERAIVVAAEEYHEIVCEAYRSLLDQKNPGTDGPRSGRRFGADRLVIGSGAIAFVLESPTAVARRGGRVLGSIENAGSVATMLPVTRDALRRAGRCVARLASPKNPSQPASLEPTHIVGSGGCFPMLRRLEQASVRASRSVNTGDSGSQGPVIWSTVDRRFGEMFSVGPLAGIAGVIMNGRLPRSVDESTGRNGDINHHGRGIVMATGDEDVSCFTAITSGFDGELSAMRLRLGDQR